MTLEQLNESGYQNTEKTLEKFGFTTADPDTLKAQRIKANSLIAKSYKKALDNIRDDIQKLYNKVTAKFTPAQLGEILKTNPAFLYTESLKFDRLQALQKKIQTEFIKASIRAGNMTIEASKTAITNNFFAQQFSVIFANRSPVNLSFTVLNPAVVQMSVIGSPQVWQQLKEKLDTKARIAIGDKFGNITLYQPKKGSLSSTIIKNRTKNLAALQNTLTQGLIKGQSFQQTAKDVKKILNGSASQALIVVRTESMRNMNAGAFANHNQAVSQGIEMQRQILSVLDDRTRPQSQTVDTRIENEDGFFIYPGGLLVSFPGNSGVAAFDINDRETVANIIDGQSPELRKGRNPLTGKNEVMSFKSYPDWMADNGFTQNKTGRWVVK